MDKRIVYAEPADYIPEDSRKKYKLGEYAESELLKKLKALMITTLICQCEHGQSRSAAVASAILEFKSRRGIQIFADDRYYTNKVVFRRVLEALKDQIPVYEYS